MALVRMPHPWSIGEEIRQNMDMDQYQEAAMRTAVFPREYGVEYCALKMASEAGEVAGKVGKMMRDAGWEPGQPLTREQKQAIIEEMGDVLWHIAALAEVVGVSLSTVADINITKLADRAKRGVIGGSGDRR